MSSQSRTDSSSQQQSSNQQVSSKKVNEEKNNQNMYIEIIGKSNHNKQQQDFTDKRESNKQKFKQNQGQQNTLPFEQSSNIKHPIGQLTTTIHKNAISKQVQKQNQKEVQNQAKSKDQKIKQNILSTQNNYQKQFIHPHNQKQQRPLQKQQKKQLKQLKSSKTSNFKKQNSFQVQTQFKQQLQKQIQIKNNKKQDNLSVQVISKTSQNAQNIKKSQEQKQDKDDIKSQKSKALTIKTVKSERTSKTINKQDKLNTYITPIEQQNQNQQDFFFEVLLKKSQSKIDQSSVKLIQKQIKQRQKQAQRYFLLSKNQYLESMMDQMLIKKSDVSYSGMSIEGIFDTIGKAMKKRSEIVENALQKGQLYIQNQKAIKKKEQLTALEKIDTARLIKIKEGDIRSKVDLMNQKINQIFQFQKNRSGSRLIQLQQKFKDIAPTAQNFSLDSQKTKIAQQYIKHLSEQKKIKNKKKKEQEQQQKKKQKQREVEQQQAMHMKMLAQKQKLIQKMKKYKQKKLEDHQHHSQQIQKIKTVLDPYTKSPRLFKRKQREYEQKFIKPMQRYRENRLKQLRDQRKLSNTKAIDQHQDRYLKAKQENQKRIEQKRILEKKQFEKIVQVEKGYFRGRNHQRILLQQQNQKKRAQSMLEMGRDKITRMQAYQRLIKKDHKPQIDQKKRDQMNQKILKQKMKNKKVKIVYKQIRDPTQNDAGLQMSYQFIQSKNLYLEGNRNLQFSKKRINKMKNKSKSGYLSQQQQIKNHNKSIKQRAQSQPKINGRNQKILWSLRKKNFGNEIKTSKQFQSAKIKMELLDQKAYNKQQFFKMGSLNWDTQISQKASLDQYYLNSIVQKMRLLQL